MVLGTSLRYIGFTRTRENVRKEGTSMIKYFTYKNRIPFGTYLILQVLQIAATIGVALLLNWIIDRLLWRIEGKQLAGLWADFAVCAGYAALLGILILQSNLYEECHDAPSGRPVGRIFIHENGRFPEKEFGPVPLSDESECGAGRGELF